MEIMIRSGEEFREWCFNLTNNYRGKELLSKGLYINAKVRKDILTSTEQARIVLYGQVKQIEFENMNGGVYRAYVSFEDV